MNSKDSLVETGLKLIVQNSLYRRGVDLRQYKDSFLKRRVDIRLRARGVLDYSQYASLLDGDPSEYNALFNALSIKVTEFFRDKEVFDAFSSHVIPELLSQTGHHRQVRIWSAGCATGEEAYTIAILLSEHPTAEAKFKVLGTDISAEAIEVAKHGGYLFSSLRNVPPLLLTKYFHSAPGDGYYRIREEIKNSLRFDVGDLATLSLPRYLDAVFCRNVLMYFDRETQREMFARFYQALKEHGYLIIGKAEAIIGQPLELFEPVMPKERIYRRRQSVPMA